MTTTIENILQCSDSSKNEEFYYRENFGSFIGNEKMNSNHANVTDTIKKLMDACKTLFDKNLLFFESIIHSDFIHNISLLCKEGRYQEYTYMIIVFVKSIFYVYLDYALKFIINVCDQIYEICEKECHARGYILDGVMIAHFHAANPITIPMYFKEIGIDPADFAVLQRNSTVENLDENEKKRNSRILQLFGAFMTRPRTHSKEWREKWFKSCAELKHDNPEYLISMMKCCISGMDNIRSDEHAFFNSQMNAIVLPPPSKISCIDTVDNDITVYVFGDLEGQFHRLHYSLIDLEIITFKNDKYEWIADENTYVVQCGDQIDAIRFGKQHKYHDLDTLYFTDYLQKISKGKFVNIIGNHEWMNVFQWFDYVNPFDLNIADAYAREKLFLFNDKIGKILRNRHFCYRINNAVFSHAGLTSDIFRAPKSGEASFSFNKEEGLDKFMRQINGLVDESGNYVKQIGFDFGPQSSAKDFITYLWPKNSGIVNAPDLNYGILWTWYYKPENLVKDKKALVPAVIVNNINIMVTGHNKNTKIRCFSHSNVSNTEVELEAANDSGLDKNVQYLVSTDTMAPGRVIECAVLTSNKGVFDKIKKRVLETYDDKQIIGHGSFEWYESYK